MEADEQKSEPMRCVIVVDEALAAGRAANVAAVIALTFGKQHPELVGADLVDGSGLVHPGLIPIGIAVLAASASDLAGLRAKAIRSMVDVVDFPSEGQQTNDYVEFGARVRTVPLSICSACLGITIWDFLIRRQSLLNGREVQALCNRLRS